MKSGLTQVPRAGALRGVRPVPQHAIGIGDFMDMVASAGTVVSVRGAVVDVAFGRDALPPINSALVVGWDRPEPLVLEVHSHIDPETVRAIALQATAGLARGTPVRSTGAPISIPVGDAVLAACRTGIFGRALEGSVAAGRY